MYKGPTHVQVVLGGTEGARAAGENPVTHEGDGAYMVGALVAVLSITTVHAMIGSCVYSYTLVVTCNKSARRP